MGVGNTIKWAILGPMIIYWLLMAHVFIHMWTTEPLPLQKPGWSAGVTQVLSH